jgi:hypothetical protein
MYATVLQAVGIIDNALPSAAKQMRALLSLAFSGHGTVYSYTTALQLPEGTAAAKGVQKALSSCLGVVSKRAISDPCRTSRLLCWAHFFISMSSMLKVMMFKHCERAVQPTPPPSCIVRPSRPVCNASATYPSGLSRAGSLCCSTHA